jgi:hypothetical protein
MTSTIKSFQTASGNEVQNSAGERCDAFTDLVDAVVDSDSFRKVLFVMRSKCSI